MRNLFIHLHLACFEQTVMNTQKKDIYELAHVHKHTHTHTHTHTHAHTHTVYILLIFYYTPLIAAEIYLKQNLPFPVQESVAKFILKTCKTHLSVPCSHFNISNNQHSTI